jgi:hypothetical protein
MRNYLFFVLILAGSLLTSKNVYCKGLTNPYEFTIDYRLKSYLPENASIRFLIISNRDFHPSQDYYYDRGLSKEGKRYFFIVSQTKDSTYLTSYNSIESAFSVFNDDKPFLVFVNGHGKNFEHSIYRGIELSERYNLNMIIFDWPTEYYALRKTAHNAKRVTANFALSINELNEVFEKRDIKSNVSVMFHSMGNLIARNMVTKDYLDNIPEDIFQNLILNAAAVRQRNHWKWVDQLDIQERIYIVSNRNDLPLKGVKLLRLTTPLGAKYSGKLSERAEYINFSEIADKEHNIFLGKTEVEKKHPNVFTFYQTLFNGSEVDVRNRNEFVEISNESGYFIL